jgi:hypothetical protein
LISKHQKRVIEANLKEDYSILQQAMRFTEYDDSYFDFTGKVLFVPVLKTWFQTYLEPHLKYSQICYNTEGCWSTKRIPLYLNGQNATWATTTGIGVDIITVRLNNGSTLCIDGYSKSETLSYFGVKTSGDGIVIWINANGDAGPNVLGQDIFVVVFTDKGIVPAGEDRTYTEVNNNCKIGATGHFCMKKVKDNGWVIPDEIWNHRF